MNEEKTQTATVVSGYGGFYQARLADGRCLECKARGRTRKTHSAILIGDCVSVSQQDETHGMIESIAPRRNQLQRPHIANVDQAVIVLAWRLPERDLLLLDNLLLMCRLAQIDTVLCFNKIDLMREDERSELELLRQTYAAADCPVVALSASQISDGNDPALDELKGLLHGKRSVLTGPSGVGKSSLLNLLLPQEQAEVGEVSERLQRGRHTTRYVRLLPLPADERGGMLADSPGFFVFDPPRELTDATLPQYYPDYRQVSEQGGGCRFDGCRHHREPDCPVRQAVSEGRLDEGRYQRYLRIMQEIREREVRY